jgi:hypothetical protein
VSEQVIAPLPAGYLPPGGRDWLRADARRWRAAAPAPWARPAWSVLALVGTALWAAAATPAPACTEAVPCGPAWAGMYLLIAALLQLWAVWRLPAVALAALGPVVAVVLAADDALGAAPATPRLAVAAAAAYAAAALYRRCAAARAQRRLAASAAGPVRQPMPATAVRHRSGRTRLALSAVLLAVAAFAAGQGYAGVADDRAHARRAERVWGVVTGQGDEHVTVALPGDTERVVPAWQEHRRGNEVAVLVDGDWARLVAEPYDAFGWQLLLTAVAVPGLALAAAGVRARRADRALTGVAPPALRVRVRRGGDGDPRVYAADDRAGAVPLLRLRTRVAFQVAGPAPDPDEEDLPDEEEPARWSEAVLHGLPVHGGEVALTCADEWDPRRVLLVRGTVAPARPDRHRPAAEPLT